MWIYTCILGLLYAHTAPRPAPVFTGAPNSYHFSLLLTLSSIFIPNLPISILNSSHGTTVKAGASICDRIVLIGVNFSMGLLRNNDVKVANNG